MREASTPSQLHPTLSDSAPCPPGRGHPEKGQISSSCPGEAVWLNPTQMGPTAMGGKGVAAPQACSGKAEPWALPSVQKMPLAILRPFCFIRGRVELEPCLIFTALEKPRFFSTKS